MEYDVVVISGAEVVEVGGLDVLLRRMYALGWRLVCHDGSGYIFERRVLEGEGRGLPEDFISSMGV